MGGQGAYLAVLAVLALAFGILGAFIATQKGRSVGEGFVLGGLFGPIGCVIEALLPTVTAVMRGPGATGPRTAAPGPVRPRRSLTSEDIEITEAGSPAGWLRYRRATTGEVFWTPAPEPEPEAEAPAAPKRWERPLRLADDTPED